jgi:hypothetical protein
MRRGTEIPKKVKSGDQKTDFLNRGIKTSFFFKIGGPKVQLSQYPIDYC